MDNQQQGTDQSQNQATDQTLDSLLGSPTDQQDKNPKYSAVRKEAEEKVLKKLSSQLTELGIDVKGDPFAALQQLKVELDDEEPEDDSDEDISLEKELDDTKVQLSKIKMDYKIRAVLAGKNTVSEAKVLQAFRAEHELTDGKGGLWIKNADGQLIFSKENAGQPASLDEAIDYYLEENDFFLKGGSLNGVSGAQKGSYGGQPKTPDEFFTRVLRGA